MKIPDFIRRAVDKPEVVVDNDYVLLSQLREQFDDFKRNASRISFKGRGPAMGAALALGGMTMAAGATMSTFAPASIGEEESEPIQATPSTPEGLYMFFRQLQEEIEQFEQERGTQPSLESIKQILADHLGDKSNVVLTPSRLFVPRCGGIVLEDYGCELTFHPLPKAVFVLFLRHPEGILLKNRKCYEGELQKIYGKMCNQETNDKIKAHCEKLVNVLDGSMDQKITTINAVLKKNLTRELAEMYQIRGERGGLKSILLDRDLVKYHKDIEDIELTVLK